MKSKLTHIIIAYFLIGSLVIPPLLQLEHIFDNSHGIVYLQDKANLQDISSNYCGDLHKVFSFHYVVNAFAFDFSIPHQDNVLYTNWFDFYRLKKLTFFSLRAPPAFV